MSEESDRVALALFDADIGAGEDIFKAIGAEPIECPMTKKERPWPSTESLDRCPVIKCPPSPHGPWKRPPAYHELVHEPKNPRGPLAVALQNLQVGEMLVIPEWWVWSYCARHHCAPPKIARVLVVQYVSKAMIWQEE